VAGLSESGKWVLSSSASSLAGHRLVHLLLNLKCDGLMMMDPKRLEKGGDRAKSSLQP